MKELDKIPTSKIERASHFVKTGAKVGVNYIKHYVRKTVDSSTSRDQLNADNAADIYNSLSEMKGSVLKLAQMLSMDTGVLPKEYVDKFSLAQFNTPPLSGPLVSKVFRNSFGKSPLEIFDTFDMKAASAASIGQVHKATKNGQTLAVKIQYPGVANSIQSDIQLVKPFAVKLFNIPAKDLNKYLDEVETKLIEETNYHLELQQSQELAKACEHIPNISFPSYFPEYSSDKILTMSWMEGLHQNDFLATNPSQETLNKIGQALWDFYMFQCHELKKLHADPHPGNFLLKADGTLVVIDFGCIKSIPDSFYKSFFSIIIPEILNDDIQFDYHLEKLEMIKENENPEKKAFFKSLYKEMLQLTAAPFNSETFDFGDSSYMAKMIEFGERVSKIEEIRNDSELRGSKHFIYVNRTFFGLYSLLSALKVNIKTGMPWKEKIVELKLS